MSERGTVTPLADGKAVMGCPDSADTEVILEAMADVLKRWLRDEPAGAILILPFPVDVTDLRIPRAPALEAVA